MKVLNVVHLSSSSRNSFVSLNCRSVRQHMSYFVDYNFTFNAYDVIYFPADEFNWYLPEWTSFDGRNVRSNVKFEQLFSIILCFMDEGFGQCSAIAYRSCYFIIILMIPTIPTTINKYVDFIEQINFLHFDERHLRLSIWLKANFNHSISIRQLRLSNTSLRRLCVSKYDEREISHKLWPHQFDYHLGDGEAFAPISRTYVLCWIHGEQCRSGMQMFTFDEWNFDSREYRMIRPKLALMQFKNLNSYGLCRVQMRIMTFFSFIKYL